MVSMEGVDGKGWKAGGGCQLGPKKSGLIWFD